ncbi:hypothetical protein WJX73_007384 [Symbiochloris irregularis]|uniref:BRCT domain-containing protein n=1 Tax=Symbiochloris irregularis TaxID=706552 RepID=A0AAW1P3Y5_9CHLO
MPRGSGCLADTRVLCEGVPEDEALTLRKIVHQLGGQWQTTIKPHDLPHVLVTTTVRTEKYKVVAGQGARIPVVTPKWVYACKDEKRMVPFKEHPLGPFAGLTICLSGGSMAAKSQHQKLITSNGGEKSPELTRFVSHLVIFRQQGPRTLSEKERWARIWGGIQIVWEEWLENTARLGLYLQDESNFAVSPPEGMQQQQQQQPAPMAQNGQLPTAARTSSSPRPQSAGSNREAAVPDSRRSHDGGGHANGGDDGGDEGDDVPFLEGVRYMLVACSPQEEAQLGNIGRMGAATRYTALKPQLTHIVVGSGPAAAPAVSKQVRQHMDANPKCVAVGPAWLHECKLRQVCLDSDARFTVDVDQLARLARQQTSAALVAEKGVANGLTQASSQAIGNMGAFKGCHFTLVATEEKDKHMAKNMILQDGGRLFTHTSCKIVADKASDTQIFAVCPMGLPRSKLDALEKLEDFRLVPAANRVTMTWLDKSMDLGFPVRGNDRAHVMFHPIPHSLPLQGADQISVSTSKLLEEVKGHVREIVTALGGRLNVKPVTVDWLVDSALAGHFLPEGPYYPPDPAPGDMHPEATQFNVEASVAGGAAKPTQSSPCNFAGVGRLAKQAPPKGVHSSLLDDLGLPDSGPMAASSAAAPIAFAAAGGSLLPATLPQPHAAREASLPADGRSLLDRLVEDSNSSLPGNCQGTGTSQDQARWEDPPNGVHQRHVSPTDALAAPGTGVFSAASAPAAAVASLAHPARRPVSLPPHVLNRMHRQPAAPTSSAGFEGRPISLSADPAPTTARQHPSELMTALSRLGDALEAVPARASPAEPPEPESTLASAGEGSRDGPDASWPGSASGGDSLGLDATNDVRKARRRGRAASELGNPPAMAKRKAVEPWMASQFEFSQQVGYDHTAKTENPTAAGRRARAGR